MPDSHSGGESPIWLLYCILSSRAPNEVGVNINWDVFCKVGSSAITQETPLSKQHTKKGNRAPLLVTNPINLTASFTISLFLDLVAKHYPKRGGGGVPRLSPLSMKYVFANHQSSSLLQLCYLSW